MSVTCPTCGAKAQSTESNRGEVAVCLECGETLVFEADRLRLANRQDLLGLPLRERRQLDLMRLSVMRRDQTSRAVNRPRQ